MAASVCWRTPRVLAHTIAPPRSAPLLLLRRGFHRPSCVWLPRPSTTPAAPASARLMAARSSSSRSLNGLAPCRAAARDGGSSGQDGVVLNDFVRDNAGGIHVIVGPMFAGKTTALLNRIREEADAGRYGFQVQSLLCCPLLSYSSQWPVTYRFVPLSQHVDSYIVLPFLQIMNSSG